MNAGTDRTAVHPPLRDVAEIWIFQDTNSGPLDLQSLSAEERARADRYRIEDKRRQFLFTRSVGRTLFSVLMQVEPGDIHWPVTGPPVISVAGVPATFAVSISHSGTVTAIGAVLLPLQIGIDFELESTPLKVSSLAAVALETQERLQFEMVPQAQQAALLLQIWTMKEAVLKSLGVTDLPDLRTVRFNWDLSVPARGGIIQPAGIEIDGGTGFVPVNSFRTGVFLLDHENAGKIRGSIVIRDPETQRSGTGSIPASLLLTESHFTKISDIQEFFVKNGVVVLYQSLAKLGIESKTHRKLSDLI